jgi:hypothetical protein
MSFVVSRIIKLCKFSVWIAKFIRRVGFDGPLLTLLLLLALFIFPDLFENVLPINFNLFSNAENGDTCLENTFV